MVADHQGIGDQGGIATATASGHLRPSPALTPTAAYPPTASVAARSRYGRPGPGPASRAAKRLGSSLQGQTAAPTYLRRWVMGKELLQLHRWRPVGAAYSFSIVITSLQLGHWKVKSSGRPPSLGGTVASFIVPLQDGQATVVVSELPSDISQRIVKTSCSAVQYWSPATNLLSVRVGRAHLSNRRECRVGVQGETCQARASLAQLHPVLLGKRANRLDLLALAEGVSEARTSMIGERSTPRRFTAA